MSKKMKIVILSSLLLNVLLLGFVIGDLSHRLGTEPFIPGKARELAVKLPEKKEALFFGTIEAVHQRNRDIHRQIREARRRAMRILTAPEFDEASYRAEVEKLYNLRVRMKRQLSDATIELAREFNQEERKALAQHLRRPPRPPKDTWGQRHGRGRPPQHEAP